MGLNVHLCCFAFSAVLAVAAARADAAGGSDEYRLGYSLMRAQDYGGALQAFAKVPATAQEFLSAGYQSALAKVELGKQAEAVAQLEILAATPAASSHLSEKDFAAFTDFVQLALGRVHFQLGDFRKAVQHYRRVRREGRGFYNALFEQSWALFMAGYPRHALGLIFDLESPFFKERLNPEVPLLKAMVYYRLCRYPEAKAALASFEEFGSDAALLSLKRFLNQDLLTPERGYQLFEDFISGVSEASLGVSHAVLKTAASQDSLAVARGNLASLLEKQEAAPADATSQPQVEAARRDLGVLLIGELRNLRSQYEQLVGQSKFLRLELLMAEKEHVLGKSLQASMKITQTIETQAFNGWSADGQSWAGDDKREYWWDEIGFHIAKVDSACRAD